MNRTDHCLQGRSLLFSTNNSLSLKSARVFVPTHNNHLFHPAALYLWLTTFRWCVFLFQIALYHQGAQYKSIPAVPIEQPVHPHSQKYQQMSYANQQNRPQSTSPPIHPSLDKVITLSKVRPPNFTCPPIFNFITSGQTVGTRLHFNLLCQPPINTFNRDYQ